MSDTRTHSRPDTYQYDQGDEERFAHLIHTPGENADAVVLEARIEGKRIKALCGKWFVPQRDPSKFPICQTCVEVKSGER